MEHTWTENCTHLKHKVLPVQWWNCCGSFSAFLCCIIIIIIISDCASWSGLVHASYLVSMKWWLEGEKPASNAPFFPNTKCRGNTPSQCRQPELWHGSSCHDSAFKYISCMQNSLPMDVLPSSVGGSTVSHSATKHLPDYPGSHPQRQDFLVTTVRTSSLMFSTQFSMHECPPICNLHQQNKCSTVQDSTYFHVPWQS